MNPFDVSFHLGRWKLLFMIRQTAVGSSRCSRRPPLCLVTTTALRLNYYYSQTRTFSWLSECRKNKVKYSVRGRARLNCDFIIKNASFSVQGKQWCVSTVLAALKCHCFTSSTSSSMSELFMSVYFRNASWQCCTPLRNGLRWIV